MESYESICELIEGCKLGERRAQERIYSMLSPSLYGLCLRYAKDESGAQEILQTGFIKVFKNITSFRGDGSFEGWVRRIIVNVAIEQYRKMKKDHLSFDLDALQEVAGDSFEMGSLEAKDLVKLIQDLPEGFRIVFNMYAIEGYSHKEIAATLRIAEGTSKSQLARARMWLKEKINVLEGGLYETHG